MKKISLTTIITVGLLIAALGATVSFNAFASARPDASDSVPVGSFDEIEAAGVDVKVSIGPAKGVAHITASDNLAGHILISTSDGKLRVRFDEEFRNKSRKGKACVTVSTPSLTEIEAMIGSNVTVVGSLNADESLELEATTGASIVVPELYTGASCDITSATGASVSVGDIDAGKLKVEASTGGNVNISGGRAAFADFEASTAGTIACAGVTVATGEAEASTGGNISCHVVDLTKRDCSTGGSVSNR